MQDNEQSSKAEGDDSSLIEIGDANVEEEIVFVADTRKTCVSDSETEDLESAMNFEDATEKPLDSTSSKEFHSIVHAMKKDSLRDENALNFPFDSYSLISLNGPSSLYFWIGVVIFLVQMTFLILLLLSIILKGHNTKMVDDNPYEGIAGEFIATDVDTLVRLSQGLSLAVTCLFVDSSMYDLIIAIHTFPIFHLATKKDKIGCFALSCGLRGIQGFMALVAAVFLIISSCKVIDVILNFAALNFISNLDNIFFEFATSGKYGRSLQNEIYRITAHKLPVCMYRRNKSNRWLRTFLFFFFLIFGSFTAITWFQIHCAKWDTTVLKVDINEAGLQHYSGCFKQRNGGKRNQRHFYSNANGTATFGFCTVEKQWFLYDGNDIVGDPCKQEKLLHSVDVYTFDVSTSFYEEWFTKDGRPAEIKFFYGSKAIAEKCPDELFSDLF